MGGASMSVWSYNDGGRSKYYKARGVGDCVVRAIAIATGKDYSEVYEELHARAGVTPRNGVKDKIWKQYLIDLGWKWTPTMFIGSGCRVHLKAEELPSGTVVCKCSKHVVTVVDGIIQDSYDSTRGGSRCVYGYFTKKLG